MDYRKIFYCVVAPLVTVGLLCIGVNEYCVKKTKELYLRSGVWHLYNNDIKDKGLALLNLSVDNGNLLMLGTSELNTEPKLKISNHPIKYFPNQKLQKEVDIIGYAGANTLINAIRIGAIHNIDKVPVVYISSFTWFLDEEYYKEGIQKNFSELQYMSFLRNPKIDDKIKKDLSKSVNYVLNHNNLFIEADLLSWIYSENTFIRVMLRYITEPYYFSRYLFLKFKDNIKAYRLVKKFKNTYNKNIKQLDEQKDLYYALIDSKSMCTSSVDSFYTYKTWYNWHKNRDLHKMRNQFSKSKMNVSKEYYYHNLLLKISNQINLKTYVVFSPVNGYFFDYAGLLSTRRNEYYSILSKMHKKEDIPFLNLKDMEYTPYAFRDNAHFTTLGWLKINENITKHFTYK